MPNINGINISDTEFTAMQELGTAFICERAFKDNVRFRSAEDIIKDNKTKIGLQKIFKKGSKQLFFFTTPIDPKSTEGKWINTFYLQQKKLLSTFSNASFKVFNREGGFMQFITDLISDKFVVSKKDSWNPADIWLIRKPMVYRKAILEELKGPSGTQTIKELNSIMRKMFREKDVVGISLKLISGQPKYEEVNVREEFFKNLESGEYDFNMSRIICKLGLKEFDRLESQDTNIFLKDSKNKEIAKFQVKGNTTSTRSNLKFEGTDLSASSARLGKAPLNLVEKLSGMVDNQLYNSKTKSHFNYPATLKEFQERQKEFSDMFDRIIKYREVEQVGIKTSEEFISNMESVFSGREPHIANSKLMQLYYIDRLLQLDKKVRNEYLTDMLYIAQKKGRKVFDFGPFGKLY